MPVPNQPALLLEKNKERTLIIADLHIGWEMALAEKGIHVPTQTSKIQQKLVDLIVEYRPRKLVILGDVKHTIATAVTSEWHDIPDFFGAIQGRVEEIYVVRGNHDGNIAPLLPESVRLVQATGLVLDGVGFFHGHRWPSPQIATASSLVMGHVHPVVVFRDRSGFRITRQVWIKANCNKKLLTRVLLEKNNVKIRKTAEQTLHEDYGANAKASRLFILPSFNDFLGGQPLNDQREGYGRRAMIVLRSRAIDMDNAETYLLDGTFLGTLNRLKALS